MTDFDDADYYDVNGDALEHGTIDEALEQYVEGFMAPGCDAEQVIREIGPIKVNGYDRPRRCGSRTLAPHEVIEILRESGYLDVPGAAKDEAPRGEEET